MSKAAKPWAPEKCPITQRPFFMWIEHHKTGEMVPTYGSPYDSYTLAEFDGEDFVCERFDHDAGGWLVDCMEGLGVKLVDDQSLVIDPNNTRYDEIEAFAAAPISAQPDLTQQTLDDVKAGIPARDAEIEALRNEIEALQAQHAATLASIEAFVACDASAISYLSLGEYRTTLLRMLRQAPAAKEPGA
jgi:hypothetical protein